MLFNKRQQLKPYEYPHFLDYMEAIRNSYWVVNEFNLTQDVQDYHQISELEREIAKRTFLAIAQIEVSVKEFWGNVHKHIPKPEVAMVGYTFAESEVRHSEAYSELLQKMGLNDAFNGILEVPAVKDRVKYLNKYLKKNQEPEKYLKELLLFTIVIENISLFSQFLIITSFNRHKNTFKGVSNIIQATSQEESLHAEFGIALINVIRQEYPHLFDADLDEMVAKVAKKAVKAENKILDWIFENGVPDYLDRNVIDNFIKVRLNDSLKRMGFTEQFDEDASLTKEVEWFYTELNTTAHVDFFDKRPVGYGTKNKMAFDPAALF